MTEPEKILALGWDAAGMLGNKQALALIEGQFGDELTLRFRNSCRVSFTKRELGFPFDYRALFEVCDGVDPTDESVRTCLAIDSPFAFPEGFRQFLGQNTADRSEDDPDSDIGDADLRGFYETIGYRDTDRYIEETFEEHLDQSRPFSPVYSMITNQVVFVKRLVDYWRRSEQATVRPLDPESRNGSNEVIEVYPKLLKDDGVSDAPAALVEREFPEHSPSNGPHQYDALISAYHAIAHACAEWNTRLPTLRDVESEFDVAGDEWSFPREEGWIYHVPPEELP